MNPKKILRGILIGSIFLVPLVPFVVSGSLFFPFITGKNFLFRILVEVMSVAWLVLALRDVSYRPKKSWLLYSFSAFLVVMTIADALALNAGKAFWSNFERMEGWITLFHLFAYFVVLGNVLKEEKIWHRLFHTTLGVALLMSFYGLAQLGGLIVINQGGVRLDATLGNATYLAIYIIFHIFFAFYFLLKNISNWKKASGYGALILLFLYILYSTASRGAVAGLILGLIVSSVLIAIFGRKEKLIRKISFIFLGVIVLFIVVFLSVKNTDAVKTHPILGRFAGISLSVLTESARAMVWPMAIEGFKEKPIFGWGQENFNYVFNAHYNPGMYGQEQWFDRTHNVVLDWLIAGGLLGLLAYLFLFISGIILLWRKENFSFIEKSVFTGLLSAYFIHNFFVFDNITSYILFFTILAYIYSKSGSPINKLERVDTEVSDEILSRSFLPIGAVLLVVVVYFVNYNSYAAAGSLIDALSLSNTSPKNGVAILEAFKKTLSYDSLGDSEVRERIVEAARSINESDAPLAVKQEFYDLGKSELEKQLEETPNDARYYLFAGNFAFQYNDIDNAIKYTEKSLELSPDKQSILYQLGNMYFVKGDNKKALEMFKKAYDVLPENEEALKYYSTAAIFSGDVALGESLLKERYGTSLIPDTRLAQIYTDMQLWDKAILIRDALIKSDPNNADYRIKYAATLLAGGYRTQAISVIKDLIKLKPEFKEQGEFYIKEIEAGRNP